MKRCTADEREKIYPAFSPNLHGHCTSIIKRLEWALQDKQLGEAIFLAGELRDYLTLADRDRTWVEMHTPEAPAEGALGSAGDKTAAPGLAASNAGHKEDE